MRKCGFSTVGGGGGRRGKPTMTMVSVGVIVSLLLVASRSASGAEPSTACPYMYTCQLLDLMNSTLVDLTVDDTSPLNPTSFVFETGSTANVISITAVTITPTMLDVGDLVYLYLAQDGVFDVSSNTIVFGSMTSASTNAGKWQINRVASVSSGATASTVALECDMDPVFLNVPMNILGYHRMVVTKFITANTLTLLANAVVQPSSLFTSLASGISPNKGGGVVPILARTIIMMDNSKINADAKGFAGGAIVAGGSFCFCTFGFGDCSDTSYYCVASGCGAQKGLSIVPYSETPAQRLFGRGAMANGGGGGNQQNSAGGGGSNVCANAGDYQWTGDGMPVPPYEAYYLFEITHYGASPNSTGGGRGGYAFSGNHADPTNSANPPGNCGAWGGDGRYQLGGLGGRPFPPSQNNLYFGGGGGAGHSDQGMGGDGGAGGGVVFIIAEIIQTAGIITTNPRISANGGDGGDVHASLLFGFYDGPGGGGAGGSIYVQLPTTAVTNDFNSSIIVTAVGGNGGDQFEEGGQSEAMGGGGAGGGGAIYAYPASIISTVNSGANGMCYRTWMNGFPPNGATLGCDGVQSIAVCSIAPTPSVTATATLSPTTSVTITPSSSVTVTPTLSPTASVTITPSSSVTVTPTLSPTTSVTITPSSSVTVTPTLSPTTSVTITPSSSVTITPTRTRTPTVTPTRTASATITPSVSATTSVSPSMTIAASQIPILTNIGDIIGLTCEGIPCVDDNPCTVEVCFNGQCNHQPQTCDDLDSCTVDECVNGECTHTVIKNCLTGDCRSFSTCDECESASSCSWLQCVNQAADFSNVTTTIINNGTQLYAFSTFTESSVLERLIEVWFKVGDMRVFIVDEIDYIALGSTQTLIGDCLPDNAVSDVEKQYDPNEVTCAVTRDCASIENNQLNAQIGTILPAVGAAGSVGVGCFCGSFLVVGLFYRRKKRRRTELAPIERVGGENKTFVDSLTAQRRTQEINPLFEGTAI